MPERIQLSRAKGWRMPENTVAVSRPGRWGNPFVVDSSDPARLAHYADFYKNVDLWRGWPVIDSARAVLAFREMCGPAWAKDARRELRGKNLACWCKPGTPCHADVLLELANPSPININTEAPLMEDPEIISASQDAVKRNNWSGK